MKIRKSHVVDIVCEPHQSAWLDDNIKTIETIPGSATVFFIQFRDGRKSRPFTSPSALSDICDFAPKPPQKKSSWRRFQKILRVLKGKHNGKPRQDHREREAES